MTHHIRHRKGTRMTIEKNWSRFDLNFILEPKLRHLINFD